MKPPSAEAQAAPPLPKITGSHEAGHKLNVGPKTLAKVFRTNEPDEALAFLGHCLSVLNAREAGGGSSEVDDQRLFMISIVNNIAARDAVERMLAVQMAATHVALVRAAGLLAKASTIQHLEAYSTAYNKLARTYAAQMEALRKHRNGGQQKVQVEHVHVHSGGQAIVGAVHHGGRGPDDGR